MNHISASAEKPIPRPSPRHDPFNGELLSEITRIPVRHIRVAGSPRTGGEDTRHIAALAEVCAELPPIVIHHETMTVIDGVHRLRAVEQSGATHISAVFFKGDESQAFVLAVKLNSRHGMPLSLAERKNAALRMLADFPEWSNRRLAEVAGLSDKTIAALRRRSGAENPHPAPVRLGRDGVAYPAVAAEGRTRALALLAVRPDATAREVSLAAGVSLTTAKDLRRRARAAVVPGATTTRPHEAPPGGRGSGGPGTVQRARAHPGVVDQSLTVRRLAADPSLRFTEAGRKLLRILDVSAVQPHDWTTMASSLPIHCAPAIAELARHHAEAWQLLAEELTERINSQSATAQKK
ncbi:MULTISPECIES: ParB/RepB/Spo0J family partition protein [Streptomyces]|uniref:ParB/RepB/Spo0J family partition protein n=1 Tax=Streptomyces koelreuteriae TaxID=2838015 RepID=A0ABX8FM00_9ACTN|nr:MULTISPECIES: ParB/RepB/Spo0J family partition protein [Streptomyces]QWB22143.1 ParB/RepB/Spo0J family partition protein [Streptomyces koelreuteriae]UUA05083.1 ParB/RepB/Spo0J family partition protein [Streptomyces koelreuteriae]UUA12707.1 ParB/RepB/Spo0J family partition protein [Streptomyces sp. CRCS-T-1]